MYTVYMSCWPLSSIRDKELGTKLLWLEREILIWLMTRETLNSFLLNEFWKIFHWEQRSSKTCKRGLTDFDDYWCRASKLFLISFWNCQLYCFNTTLVGWMPLKKATWPSPYICHCTRLTASYLQLSQPAHKQGRPAVTLSHSLLDTEQKSFNWSLDSFDRYIFFVLSQLVQLGT